MPVFLIVIAIGAAMVVLARTIPNAGVRREARNAYYNQDYMTAYRKLSGLKLNKSDRIIYEKVSLILSVSNQLDLHELHKRLGDDLRALDDLFEGVRRYEKRKEKAEELGIDRELAEVYTTILRTMDSKYALTENDVHTVLGYEDPIIYTKILYSVLEGNGIDIFTIRIPDDPVESKNDKEHLDDLEDVLSEEQDILKEIESNRNQTVEE